MSWYNDRVANRHITPNKVLKPWNGKHTPNVYDNYLRYSGGLQSKTLLKPELLIPKASLNNLMPLLVDGVQWDLTFRLRSWFDTFLDGNYNTSAGTVPSRLLGDFIRHLVTENQGLNLSLPSIGRTFSTNDIEALSEVAEATIVLRESGSCSVSVLPIILYPITEEEYDHYDLRLWEKNYGYNSGSVALVMWNPTARNNKELITSIVVAHPSYYIGRELKEVVTSSSLLTDYSRVLDIISRKASTHIVAATPPWFGIAANSQLWLPYNQPDGFREFCYNENSSLLPHSQRLNHKPISIWEYQYDTRGVVNDFIFIGEAPVVSGLRHDLLKPLCSYELSNNPADRGRGKIYTEIIDEKIVTPDHHTSFTTFKQTTALLYCPIVGYPLQSAIVENCSSSDKIFNGLHVAPLHTMCEAPAL